MKIWLLNISVTILVTTVTSLVLSKGKTATFVKCMFSILTLLVVIKPFASIKTEDINIKDFIYQDKIVIKEDFIEYAFNNRIGQTELLLEQQLCDLGIENAKINIYYEINGTYDICYKNIHVNLKNAVIKTDKEHIVIIEDIKNYIAQILTVNKDILVIYE